MAPGGSVPDALLDADRLSMLLEVIMSDYITASYASRENGKRVVLNALQKLCLSVYASAPQIQAQRPNIHQEPAFVERCNAFYDELMNAFSAKRREERSGSSLSQLDEEIVDGERSISLDEEDRDSRSSYNQPRPRMLEDSLVKEVMKPRLVQFVNEICQERDRQLIQFASQPMPDQPPLSSGSMPMRAPPLGLSGVSLNRVPSSSEEIRMEGWLRKKGQHVNLWRERYFMIRTTADGTHYLCYFRRKGDRDPRGWFVLGPGTTVDDVRVSSSKIEAKRLYTFRIRHLTHVTAEEIEEASRNAQNAVNEPLGSPSTTTNRGNNSFMDSTPSSPDPNGDVEGDMQHGQPLSNKRRRSRRFRNRAAAAAAAATAATAVVLTGGLAGVGIGMMGMGMSAAAAASAAGAGAIIVQHRNRGPIALAAESLEIAEWWRNSILECILQAEEQWKRYLSWYMDHDHDLISDAAAERAELEVSRLMRSATIHAGSMDASEMSEISRPRTGSFGNAPRSIVKTFRTSATFSQETYWTLYDHSFQLRVEVERTQQHRGWKAGPPPALRTRQRVQMSPKDILDLIMDTESRFYRNNHIIASTSVVEQDVKDHSDVLHMQLSPISLWPIEAESRDLCLLRYWRKEEDGSYFVCFQSTTHKDCPRPNEDTVRASMLGGGFIISPRVDSDEDTADAWVTLTLQLNPNGWLDSTVARYWYFVHAYGARVLEMISALNGYDGGVACSTFIEKGKTPDVTSNVAPQMSPRSQLIVSEIPVPILEPYEHGPNLSHPLPTHFWSEPDASTFFVRGAQYLSTSIKRASAPQAMRLIGVELYASRDRVQHVGTSSISSNSQLPFLFIVNFMLPGPPCRSLVIYFARAENEGKKLDGFGALCDEFLRGDSDEMRRKRLKLIPRVVEGTWRTQHGVGSTPAILGTKVDMKCYRGDKYLEIDYDIGSSVVASALVKILLGQAPELVIDLAFVIEAQERDELPERALGCVRLTNVDVNQATKR